MKYIAYVRKSTDDKKKQIQSMPNQIDWVKKTAQQLGIQVVKTFSDKKTAKQPGREGFGEMMHFIYNSQEPLGIICWKLNRLARNPIDGGAISYALIENKIKHIHASDRQFKPEDNQILLGVEFGAATQYSIDLKNSVNFGMNRKIELGYRPTSVPFGYINDAYSLKGEKKIYKDPERFDILQNAWKKLLTGAYSVEMIRKELNSNGFISKNGRPLIQSYLYKMFSNTFYAGYYTWQGQVYKGKHPKMVTPAEFERVQKILGKKSSTRAYKNDQLFSGIITCGECNYGITSEHHTKTIKSTGKQKQYTYLRCTKKNPLVKCGQKYVSFTKAEKQIQTTLENLQLPKYYLDWFCVYYEKHRKQDVQELGRKKAALQKKINDNKGMMQRLMDNLNRELIDDEQYNETMKRYKAKAVQLNSQLEKLEAGNNDWIEQLKSDFHFANTTIKKYKKGTKNTKREILTRISSNWTLKDRKLDIALLPPFALFNKCRVFHDAEISRLELISKHSDSRKTAALLSECSWWRPLWDEVRNHYLNS